MTMEQEVIIMWTGGVRVAVANEDGKLLLVRHHYAAEGKDVWMLPGGAIEEGETSRDSAIREVLEETGLVIHVGRLLWHVEEVSETRGQRFVNFFAASVIGGQPELGEDPELGDAQVLDRIGFFAREELAALGDLYPDTLMEEIWGELEADGTRDSYRIRK
jgi:ADP-ribose pyrophosphatase YjhB (NUDIX family)